MDEQLFPGVQDALQTSQESTTLPGVDEALAQTQTPQDVTTASSVGEQPDSPKYNGYCQQFVDDVMQTPPERRAPSASAAWQNYQAQGQGIPDTKGMQPGDLIYFSDPNDPNGHVGIFSGSGKFISATQEDPQHPVQNHSITEWENLTGQQVLGYVKNPSNLPQIGGSYGSN